MTFGLIGFASQWAFAQQNPGESFFDRYLPIAQLFDSPIFFGFVIGSAALLLVGSFIFLQYAKGQEKKAVEWSKEKTPESIVGLLHSADPQESRLAYIYLRSHSGEKEIALLTSALEDQRRRGSIDPASIYLLEELEAQKALPILEQIARGKTSVAPLAQRAADRLIALQEEEQEKMAPAKQAVK